MNKCVHKTPTFESECCIAQAQVSKYHHVFVNHEIIPIDCLFHVTNLNPVATSFIVNVALHISSTTVHRTMLRCLPWHRRKTYGLTPHKPHPQHPGPCHFMLLRRHSPPSLRPRQLKSRHLELEYRTPCGRSSLRMRRDELRPSGAGGSELGLEGGWDDEGVIRRFDFGFEYGYGCRCRYHRYYWCYCR
jgi:hypothetical protein